tara:strand:- start:124 stop:4605 length:4482 start_codon:yes stop_codon:yes gene_type:complete
MSEDRRQPFLKRAQGKSADDRTFFEKLAVSIYGEDKPILPDAVLDDSFENIVEQLPLDVQGDVARYKNIFRETPEVLENYLKEYRDKGFSDYIEKGRFYDDLQLKGDDQLRLQDYNFLGKGMYDAAYRKDEAGGKARQKILESVPGQLATGVSVGLGSAVRGTAELVASLSDLYLDTEILDNVERALGDVDINKIYEGDAGTLARFTSILTQYGTGFAVAQKIVKKLAGKAIKTRLAEKSAKALLKTEGAKNLAKFGGYYMLPAGIADTAVSTTDQQSLGEIFGKDDGNLVQNILYNTSLEDIEGLTGKERAAAVLRNKLKFGAEGTAFMGTLKLIGPAVKTTAKGTGVLLNNVVGPALTGAAKVITYKNVIPEGFKIISKGFDKAVTKSGIPKQEFWKFGDFQSGVKSAVFRGLDEVTSRLKSGGKFNVQTRNELKRVEGLNKSAKKDFDIFAKALDGEMYKLVNAGFDDILFNTGTANRAMTYWDDVLKYMRGELKLNQLPKSLQQYSQAIRKLVDDQQEKIVPILKDMKIKDDTLKNMGRYFKTSYEIFKNNKFRAPKEDYQTAIKYFEELMKKAGKTYRGVGSGTDLYKQKLNKDAIQTVNKVLEIGRAEGTTPAKRLKAIVNVMEGEKIPKNTFAKFFGKEQLLPDQVARLLGRVEDPKAIIMDTIAEQAYIVNNYNAYKEIADFGLGKFLFRNTNEFQDFLIKNNIAGSRLLSPIKLSKPYNVDFDKLFTNPDGTPLLTLPEMAKAMKDSTVFMDQVLKLPLMKSLLGIKATVQMNKTVLSLMTQMRNITTAAMFATANGHVGAGASVSDTFKYLFDDLIGKTKNPDELRKLLKEALDNGAIDTSTIAQELQQMIPELMGSAKVAGRTLYEGKTSDQIFNYLFTNKGALGKVVQKAIESYQMGDNLWKLYGYNFTKSQLNAALRNMGDVKKYFREIEGYDFRPLKADGTKKTLDDALQEIAGIQVRDVYPNYSMIPTFVLNVRKFPLAGNFVAFVSEMYRNSFQILRRGLREMQSSNPYLQQIGARRLLGYMTTVGVALPTAKKMGQVATEISDEVLDAYANRFAPEFEKGHTMVPVEAQNPKTKAWKSTDMSTMVPYADILTPFRFGMQTILSGKNPDQTALDLYTRGFVDYIKKTLEPFLAPSIAAETALELIPKNGQFRTKSGGLIADIRNDDDWWGKVMYHAYKKLTPTTIRSAEEIAQAVGGDLSKAGIKRDLYDTVLKVLTGFGIRRQDPYQAFRFKLGRYSKELGNAKAAFTTDVTDARKLQTDLRLIERNLSPEYFTKEYEKLQSNKYRIMSELYKDVEALRTIGFNDKEIITMMQGRRAVSKADINSIMVGIFNPDKPPSFRQDSGIIKAIEQINRETENNYKVKDFVDIKAIADVQKKYSILPLGLSQSERENLLRTTLPGKREQILRPAIQERREIIRDQQGAVPQTPIPNVPMPNIAPVTAAVDQNTGLTRTEQALLSPEEQLIAQRNKGILSLV